MLSSDAGLAARVRHGDRRALRALTRRYGAEVYDFAAAVTGTEEAAAGVVEATFTAAWDRLRLGIAPPRLEPWLLGIARAHALAVPGAAVRLPPAAAGHEPRAELARRWAETLAPREYAVLDLYVRRGLTVRELAAQSGASEQAVRRRLERLGAELEDFAACELVLRRAVTCIELRVALDRTRGMEERDRRRAVRLHARLCEGCGAAAQRATAPLVALGDLPSVAPAAETAAAIGSAIARHAGGPPVPVPARPAAQPPAWKAPRRPRGRLLLAPVALAGLAVVAALAVTTLDPFGGGGETRVDEATVRPRLVPPVSVFTPPTAGSRAPAEPAPPAEKTPGPESRRTDRRAPAPQRSAAPAPPATPSGGSSAPATPASPRATPRQSAPPPQQRSTEPPSVSPPAASPPAAGPPAAAPRDADARTLAWAPVTGAVGYELVLLRNGRQVYTTRTREPRAVIPQAWKANGRVVALGEGYYRWIVWPLTSAGKAEKAVVVSNLHLG